ncbi:MAG: hypothetical protein J0L64_27550, partial [Acidobacteria bacterium]|nr:hypothetical protein [Acidobacteriota bacterium]
MRLACLALALGSLHALSAMCPPPGPTLCRVARSEVVFLGRAVEAYPHSQKHAAKIWRPRLTRKNRPANWNDNFIPSQTTRFEVLEGFRGVSSKYVVLHTKMESHIGYIFEQGATYLVFAYRDESNGVLDTSGCGRTQPITGDNPDLTTIRQIFAETKRGRLYGYATTDRTQFLFEFERPVEPVPNVRLTLTSPTLTLERTT